MGRSSGVSIPGDKLFTPGFYGATGALGYYTNPLSTVFAANAKTVGIAGMAPYFSGPSGGLIQGWDVGVSVISTGGTIYAAAYTILDQRRPFRYNTTPLNYATLLATCGSVATSATGRLTVALGTPVAVPPNTWFLFGGYNDVSAASTFCGSSTVGVFSPWGRFNTSASNGTSGSIGCNEIDVPGLSGGAWPANIPDSAGNQGRFDLGLGLKFQPN